jgi:hypothetical protein
MVCVSGVWVGVDNAWEQKKIEIRNLLENGARRRAAVPSPAASACFVRFCCCFPWILLLCLGRVLHQDTEALQQPHLMDTVYQ